MPQWWNSFADRVQYTFRGIPLWRFLAAAAIVAAAVALRGVIWRAVGGYILAFTRRTRYKLDTVVVEALATPLSWAIVFAGIYGALLALGLPWRQATAIDRIFGAALAFLVMVWLLRFIDGLAGYFRGRLQTTDTSLDKAVIPTVRTAAKIAVVVIVIIWVLNNFNYPVASILTGLGIGGLAVALAAQQTLANWFGAFMIFSDRPFVAGDRIVVTGYDGFVEQVGLRSTRIRLLDGNLVTIPNSMIANNQVKNITRSPANQVNTDVGISYDTPYAKVIEALDIIKDVLRSNDDIRNDYTVRLEDLGDSALAIRLIYWTLTGQYLESLRMREAVNLEIFRRLTEAGIKFAHPIRTVYLKGEGKPPDMEPHNGAAPPNAS